MQMVNRRSAEEGGAEISKIKVAVLHEIERLKQLYTSLESVEGVCGRSFEAST